MSVSNPSSKRDNHRVTEKHRVPRSHSPHLRVPTCLGGQTPRSIKTKKPDPFGFSDPFEFSLAGRIELKHGAGRAKDIADLIELIKRHRSDCEEISQHLATIHPTYAERFQELITEAENEY